MQLGRSLKAGMWHYIAGRRKLHSNSLIFSEHLNKWNMWIPVPLWAREEQEWKMMEHLCVKEAASGEKKQLILGF